MDHSALIANTTFRDQQEQIEFRAFAEVQIQQLETIVQDQQNQADAREQQFFAERSELEQRYYQLELELEAANQAKQRVQEQMDVRCDFLQQKLEQAAYDKEVEFKHYMEKIQLQF